MTKNTATHLEILAPLVGEKLDPPEALKWLCGEHSYIDDALRIGCAECETDEDRQAFYFVAQDLAGLRDSALRAVKTAQPVRIQARREDRDNFDVHTEHLARVVAQQAAIDINGPIVDVGFAALGRVLVARLSEPEKAA